MNKALGLLCITLAVIGLVLFTVPRGFSRGSLQQATGTVTGVYQCGREAILKVKGLQNGFSLQKVYPRKQLQEMLLGKQVVISYKECWNPLDPAANKPVAELRLDEELFYAEPTE